MKTGASLKESSSPGGGKYVKQAPSLGAMATPGEAVGRVIPASLGELAVPPPGFEVSREAEHRRKLERLRAQADQCRLEIQRMIANHQELLQQVQHVESTLAREEEERAQRVESLVVGVIGQAEPTLEERYLPGKPWFCNDPAEVALSVGKFFPDGFKPNPERDMPAGKWRSVSSEVNAVFADHLGSTALLKCRSDVGAMCDQLEASLLSVERRAISRAEQHALLTQGEAGEVRVNKRRRVKEVQFTAKMRFAAVRRMVGEARDALERNTDPKVQDLRCAAVEDCFFFLKGAVEASRVLKV